MSAEASPKVFCIALHYTLSLKCWRAASLHAIVVTTVVLCVRRRRRRETPTETRAWR